MVDVKYKDVAICMYTEHTLCICAHNYTYTHTHAMAEGHNFWGTQFNVIKLYHL